MLLISGGLFGFATNTCERLFSNRTLTIEPETNLENVKRLELNVSTPVSKHVHHHLQVGLGRNVARHDVVVCTVKKDLSQ